MSKIDISINQATLEAAHAQNLTGLIQNLAYPDMTQQIATVVEPFLPFNRPINSVQLAGSTLYMGSPDGSMLVANLVREPDTDATSGTVAFDMLEYAPAGSVTRSVSGMFAADYAIAGGVLVISNIHGVATSGYLSQNTPGGGGSFTGSLVYEANGNVHGEVTSFRTEAGYDGPKLTGSVNVNMAFGQDGAWHTSVGGVATSYRYVDVEHGNNNTEVFTDVALTFDSSHPLDRSFLADASRFAGDDEFSISLGDNLYEPWQINSGTGNDRISLFGGGSKVSVDAGSGNDWIGVTALGVGNHVIDGGEGTDTFVLRVYRPEYTYTIDATPQGINLRSSLSPDSVQQLHNIERIEMGGVPLAFDVDGAAGQAYRLYRAAFDRTPDKAGLSFWIKSLDVGVSLNQAAADFIKSDEFVQLYGSNPDDKAFLTGLYKNVLHRAPDDGGYAFWLDGMAHGVTRASVLQQFSESPENQAQVNEVFVTGVQYDPNPF